MFLCNPSRPINPDAGALKAVLLQFDETSDADNPRWLVSKARLGDGGEIVQADTLSTHTDFAQAGLAALNLGRKLGLDVLAMLKDVPVEALCAG